MFLYIEIAFDIQKYNGMNKFFIIGQVTKNWRSIKQYAAAVFCLIQLYFSHLAGYPASA